MKKLDLKQLKVLRSLYSGKYPKFVPTLGLLDQFIDRFTHHPEWMDKVKFVSINENTLKNGTFIMVYSSTNALSIACNTLESAPYKNLESLLHTIEFLEGKFYKFWTVSEVHFHLIDSFIKSKNVEKIDDYKVECYAIDFDKDKTLKQLEDAPTGYYYDSIRLSDVPRIESTITYFLPSGYVETVVKYNPTTGLFRNDGELVAWSAMHENGESGLLEVTDEYRKQGLGKGIIVRQGLKFHERGRLGFMSISHGNKAGQGFTDRVNLGDVSRVGTFRYITVKMKSNKNLKTKL